MEHFLRRAGAKAGKAAQDATGRPQVQIGEIAGVEFPPKLHPGFGDFQSLNGEGLQFLHANIRKFRRGRRSESVDRRLHVSFEVAQVGFAC